MGKVHGSLARAGKVKSQTPKVQSLASPPNNPAKLLLQSSLNHNLTFGACTGRSTREEEDTQGPSEEENHIYKAVCERNDDRWQAKGMDKLP
jgi:hypothetical protein